MSGRERHVRRAGVGLGMVALALWASATPAHGQSWRTLTESRQITEERELDVRIEYAAGQFTVRRADEGVLYRMSLRYDEDDFEPVVRYREGSLRVGIDGRDRKIRVGKGGAAGHLDLDLAPSLPMDLRMEFGAVRAELDLGGLALTHLEMTTGASETLLDVSRPNPVSLDVAELKVGAAQFEARRLGNLNAARIAVDAGVGDITLDLTGRWQRNATLTVDMGVGSLELRVPESLGVRLRKDSFLTAVDAGDLEKDGDTYVSPGYDQAQWHLDVDIDAAFGKIAVVVVDG